VAVPRQTEPNDALTVLQEQAVVSVMMDVFPESGQSGEPLVVSVTSWLGQSLVSSVQFLNDPTHFGFLFCQNCVPLFFLLLTEK